MTDKLLMIYANIRITPIEDTSEDNKDLAKWELKQILLNEVERLFEENFPENGRGEAQIAHNTLDYPDDTPQ